jgi:uncharacterized protein YodC (DUF2158 family)
MEIWRERDCGRLGLGVTYMPNEIKPGDVVQLKSGGPKMTVGRIESINGVASAVCGWFNGNKKEVGTFPVHSLKLAE